MVEAIQEERESLDRLHKYYFAIVRYRLLDRWTCDLTQYDIFSCNKFTPSAAALVSPVCPAPLGHVTTDTLAWR